MQQTAHPLQTADALGASHGDDAVAALLAAPPERTYRMTHRFAAPPALAWAVWTDPAHIPNWWGPRGITYGAPQASGARCYTVRTGPTTPVWPAFSM